MRVLQQPARPLCHLLYQGWVAYGLRRRLSLRNPSILKKPLSQPELEVPGQFVAISIQSAQLADRAL